MVTGDEPHRRLCAVENPSRVSPPVEVVGFSEAASSLRIHWEMQRAGPDALPSGRIGVPTGIAHFPGEIGFPPRSWVEAVYDVVRWRRFELA